MGMAESHRPVRLALEQDRQHLKERAGMAAKTAQQIDAEAAQWAARIDRGDLLAE